MMKIVRTLVSNLLVVLVYFFMIACQEERKSLFIKMSAAETGITFVNENKEDDHHNILTYEYFYNGGGVGAGDINNDGWVDLFFVSNQGENKLYLNHGNMKFEDITARAGVSGKSGWKTGVALADVNADGYLDIYVCRSAEEHPFYRYNTLYINNHDLTFSDQAHQYGLDDDSYSTQAAFLDYDRDGDLDMFLLNHSRLHISNAYDVSRRYTKQRVPYVGNKFFRNDKGKFKDVSDSVGIFGPASNYGLGIAYGDLNGDDWIDLYTSNDYTEKDKIYLNESGKYWREATDSLLDHISQFSMGVDIADVNNDGWNDILTLDMLPEDNQHQKEFYWPDRYDVYMQMVKNGLHHQYMRNMLHINQGNGTFIELGQQAGVSNTDWSWAGLFADFDLDGWQDIFISNGFKRNFTSNDFLRYKADLGLKQNKGSSVTISDLLGKMPSNKVHNYLYKNVDGTSFLDYSTDAGLAVPTLTNGAAYADLDNDGDLDLVMNNLDDEAGIYKNNAREQGKHFLKLRLEGNNENTMGLGAEVRIYARGTMQTRTLCPYRGFQSTVEPGLFFGLGDLTVIDSLSVNWPTGEHQVLQRLPTDQTITLKQRDAIHKNHKRAVIEPIFHALSVNELPPHVENNFTDYKVQLLLPRMYSTMGPALAVADVNNDGKMDVLLGGSKGSTTTLSLSHGEKSAYTTTPLDPKESHSEDVDAIFFDMDKDGDQDAYIVTGGYEFAKDDPALADRLYRNDGLGNFEPAPLPSFLSSGSCARAADVDGDGDMDLFVGGRIVPSHYPQTPDSYLLINDGKGIFSIAEEQVAPGLKKIGMVSDAQWADLNKDGLPDLVLLGEWMPVTIMMNHQGRLVNETSKFFSSKTEGWWNSLMVIDFDKDGDDDLFAGNFGMNNQLRADSTRPVHLYYDDFDNNGSIDPLLTYFIGSKSYPAPTRDELTDQLPSFKKRFPDYSSYAQATIDKVLTPEEMKRAKVLTAYHFQSMYFKNENGKFIAETLPAPFQYAPIFAWVTLDIDFDGLPDVVGGGNLSAMNARYGRATGIGKCVALNTADGGLVPVSPLVTGLDTRGDVRKLIAIGDTLWIAENGKGVTCYYLKHPSKANQ